MIPKVIYGEGWDEDGVYNLRIQKQRWTERMRRDGERREKRLEYIPELCISRCLRIALQ